jgi:hypothetical protein
MTVSYIIIIVIIWKKSSVKIKDETSNERNEKSRLRRLLPSKKPNVVGKKFFIFVLSIFILFKLDDHQIEPSIRNVRSLGVIPRAKIKTIKMTLVIVIGKTTRVKYAAD